MLEGYIPITVKGQGKKRWYLDVSKLSLSELLSLRNELLATDDNTIKSLDGLIHNKYNIIVNNSHYYDKTLGHIRKDKQENKNTKQKIKRKSKERKRRK